MSRQTPNRLKEARVLVASGRYQDAMRIYTELCAREPLNTPVFSEMLGVQGHLINIKSGAELMNMKREENIVQGKRYLSELLASPVYDDEKRLERFGWKAYSQNDEDGIIGEIFRRIGTGNRRFFEFGVEVGTESNTHCLLHSGRGRCVGRAQ